MDAVGEEFQIHLVADAGARRHDAQLLERLLAPAQELVALAVAAEFDGDVFLQRVGGRPAIDLDRMVHDEVHGHERLDDAGIPAAAHHFRAQAGEVHDARHARQVLQQDARGQVGDFVDAIRAGLPAGEGLDVAPLVGRMPLVAQRRFQQDADDVRQLRQRRAAQGFRRRETVVGHGLAVVRKGFQRRNGLGHGQLLYMKMSCENSGWRGLPQSKKTGAESLGLPSHKAPMHSDAIAAQ